MTEIIPDVFIGGEAESKDFAFLKGNRITHILSAGAEFDRAFPYHQLTYLLINATQSPGFVFYKRFDEIARFVLEGSTNRNRILIHDNDGTNRAATCLLAYLLRADGYTLNEAIALVKVKRSDINPNQGK